MTSKAPLVAFMATQSRGHASADGREGGMLTVLRWVVRGGVLGR